MKKVALVSFKGKVKDLLNLDFETFVNRIWASGLVVKKDA